MLPDALSTGPFIRRSTSQRNWTSSQFLSSSCHWPAEHQTAALFNSCCLSEPSGWRGPGIEFSGLDQRLAWTLPSTLSHAVSFVMKVRRWRSYGKRAAAAPGNRLWRTQRIKIRIRTRTNPTIPINRLGAFDLILAKGFEAIA